MADTLIVYYSQARGNTKRIAEKIQKAKGYDIAEIETAKPYTGSYEEIVDRGQEEVNTHYQPNIKNLSADLNAYSRIIIGSPTWWYTMAPAVLTFLNSNDFSGKTVIPFSTHGGWPGHLIKDIKALCNGAEFEKEKEIQFDSTGGAELITPESEIDEWIKQL